MCRNRWCSQQYNVIKSKGIRTMGRGEGSDGDVINQRVDKTVTSSQGSYINDQQYKLKSIKLSREYSNQINKNLFKYNLC